jgi:hypothetical protein
MVTVLAIGVLILLLSIPALMLLIVYKGTGININITHTHVIPAAPPTLEREIEQYEEENTKKITDAAQAIQRFFLDEEQIDTPEVKHNG